MCAVVGGIFCAAKATWISRAQPARSLTVEGILRTMSARVCSAVGPRCLLQPMSETAISRQATAEASRADDWNAARTPITPPSSIPPLRMRPSNPRLVAAIMPRQGGDRRQNSRAPRIASPDPDALLRRAPHRLAGLHAERLVELGDVRHRAEHAPFRRRVHVRQQPLAQAFARAAGSSSRARSRGSNAASA